MSGPVLCEPLAAFAPLHPPEAVQEVALVEFHVSVEAPPLLTVVGAALRVAPGCASVLEGLTTPPHAAASSDAQTGTKRTRNLR